MASKGKGIAGKDSSSGGGKRKRPNNNNNDDKTGGNNKKNKRNRDVLQFFEDSAFECDGLSSDDASDDFFDDDFLDDFDADPKVKSEPGRFEEQGPRLFPKEEELSGDELERMLEERYRSGSGFVRYAEDDYDNKRSVDRSFVMPSIFEPIIWKVKCKVGRERHTVFCLMQKYVDLKELGTKLQIISAFAIEHIKGFVFIEAERQNDVTEACNQLADVYFSLVTKVPSNEVSQLLVVRKRFNDVKEGTWARVKNGIYKGDIAQVVAVNKDRKRATVKLIPRVDLQALAGKYGGGGAVPKKTKGVAPAARLISSSELEEFRPHMQCRRDRDTGKFFEFLDGLMLKDGFLYKKVSIDSLSFWDINPTEEELQKFTLPTNDESDNLEWLSQLYGEQKKKSNVMVNNNNNNKGGGKGDKGEGPSGSNDQSNFEVHDLVLFGKRDFGMVIGMEKDENYKILKHGSEGSTTTTLGEKDLKYVPMDKKFTALDRRMKTISVNDTVRIVDGPTKGREGIVKQIYRGIIFLYDENDFDNAYFCTRSQMSEKVRHVESSCGGKVEEGPSGFEDAPSSPKSPLSAKKPWQREDERRDQDGTFSVGQSLRIRIGPLKGYLCRVLAVRFSDVTVKLDSQQKVLTVKREHLSEVRKTSATSMSDDMGLNSSFKPFDLLGSDGGTNDWLQGASGSADGDGWNVGGLSSGGNAWPSFSSADASLQVGTSAGALPSSADNGSGKDVEDSAWLSKAINNQNSSWGAAGNDKAVGNEQVGGWGTSDGWGKSSGTGASSSWGSAKVTDGDHAGSWKVGGSSMDQGKDDTAGQDSWNKQSADKGLADSWNKGKVAEEAGGWGNTTSRDNVGSSGWGKQSCEKKDTWGTQSLEQGIAKPGGDAWGEAKGTSDPAEDSWGKAAGKWGNKDSVGSSGWGKQSCEKKDTWGTQSLEQGIAKPGGDAWGEAKGTSDPAEDSWGKAAGKWGNKDSSNDSGQWKNSAAASDSQAGGWGQAQGQGAAGSGGWKTNSLDELSKGKWGKDNSSDWGKPEGTQSWGQSRSGENDQGYGDHGSGGRRGRGRGGRDQPGRGRGGSFGRGQNSSWNPDNQAGTSWGNSSDGNKDQGNDWGKAGGWGQAQGQSAAGSGGWKTNSQDEHSKGTWGKDNSSDWGKQEGTQSWGQSRSGENDQGYGDRGSGGRRGRGRGGRDQPGRGRGGSFGHGRNSSWNQDNQAGTWGSSRDGNKDQGNEWGKSDWTQGSRGSRESSRLNSADPSSERNTDSSGWKQPTSWEKSKSGADNSSWGKSTDKGVNEPWGKANDSEDKVAEGSSQDPWGKAADKGVSAGNSSKGWGKASGSWSQSQEDSTAAGWKDAGGWKSSGESGQGKDSWSTPKSFGAEGGASWGKSGGNNSWEQSKNFDNDREYSGGRGFGGRRGRGRDQSGRGRGRSFDRGNFSSWTKDGPESGAGSSWSKNQGGSSWGNTSAGNDGQGSTWGGGSPSENGGWGKAKGWNDNGADHAGKEPAVTKGWNADQGGSSWGNSPANKAGNDGQGGSSWGNKAGQGGSSWGNSSGGNNGGSSWSQERSNSKVEDKSWSKPNEGGSSWGTNKSNDQGSSWGKSKGWNDKGADITDKGSTGDKSWNSDKGVSSWGNASGKPSGDAGQGGGSWGKSPGNQAGTDHGGSAWGNTPVNKGGTAEQGGSSWGKSPGIKEGSAEQGGSSWGKSSGKPSGDAGQGGGSWGKSPGNQAGTDHGGSAWGNTPVNKGDTAEQGGSSWGKSPGNKEGSAEQGGSSWGKSSDGNNAGGGGWGKSSDGNNAGGGGWGKSSDGNNAGGGGWA